jgi:hypothetical protein
MLYAKPWDHHSAVATMSIVILLSAWINPSTRCTVASVTISIGPPAGHHLRLSNVPERTSRPNCELLYTTNTSHPKQEIFLYKYPLYWVLLPTKYAQQNADLRQYSPQTWLSFYYWNQPLNIWMYICCLDCHEAELCCHLVMQIENLLHPLQLFYFHLW